ncbi:RidA family protein [Dyadobacter pollutisoli]|uniref:RidA family protein n=1 Tax=Dyadobacter pollutisoli TaxID=2910158 RepID=A0A9E8SKN4_9BACT|nr:RidA family protein [Dyadobacter pollutisoli]WAC12690.1 RidA family protein [Dyadobacter pollutisoli]
MPLEKSFTNPEGLPKWPNAFSQIVTVSNSGMTTIYLSGQASVDQNNNLIGENDLRKQTVQAFTNLQLALESAGATTKDIVKMNIYVKNYKPEDADTIGHAFRSAFPFENLPASTWLGVQSLALEGLLIEIDAIAVVAEKQ